MNSGIYAIINIKNNKRYIGQSRYLNRREKEHFTSLRKNKHHNQHLQNSWNKYGEGGFEFSILERCTEAILDELEIFYINKYNSCNRHCGYNLKQGGDGGTHNDKTKEKMSLIRTATGGMIATKQFLRVLVLIGEGKSNTHIKKEIKLSVPTIETIRSGKYNPENSCFDWYEYHPDLDWYVDSLGSLHSIDWDKEFVKETNRALGDIWSYSYFDDNIDGNELLKTMYDYEEKHRGDPIDDYEEKLWNDYIKNLNIIKYITDFKGDWKEDVLGKCGYGEFANDY